MPLSQSATAQKGIPVRADLLDRLERANRKSWLFVIAQLIALGAVGYLIDWRAVVDEPLLSIVAVGVMVGPLFNSIVRLWAQNKKEIDDLREDTRFGEFDKHRLRTLQRETSRRLNLPDSRLPVFITADKTMNAMSVRLGLAAFFKSLNGIYLHRQVLHRLTPEEVQDLMGHEMGHYYRYYLVSDRFRSVTVLLGATLGLLVAQWTGMSSFISLIISFAVASAFWTLTGLQTARLGETIEYLCDDLGAQVHGPHVSINGLLKLGVDAELQSEIQQQAILSTASGTMNATSVIRAVEAAMPYGINSREELEKEVERSLRVYQRKDQQLSLGGFLNYAWNSEAEEDIAEQLEEQAQRLKALRGLPRIPWESLLKNPAEIHFEEHELPALVQLIESHPTALLFHLPSELEPNGDLHPPLRKRILYLWYNRDEIARNRTSSGLPAWAR